MPETSQLMIRSSARKWFLPVVFFGLLAVAYWWFRPHWRLPFDPFQPAEAVAVANGWLWVFPEDTWRDTSMTPLANLPHPSHLLPTLRRAGLDQDVPWKSWWAVPHRDESGELTYLWIGRAARGLHKAWNPRNYGPELGGAATPIYSLSDSLSGPVHIARAQQLLFVASRPFQIEEALYALRHPRAGWWGQSDFRRLYRKWRSEAPAVRHVLGQPAEWAPAVTGMWGEGAELLEATGLTAREISWLAAGQAPDGSWRSLALPRQPLPPAAPPAAYWELAPANAYLAREMAWEPLLAGPKADEFRFLADWAAPILLRGRLNRQSPRGQFLIWSIRDTTDFRRAWAQLGQRFGVSGEATYQTYELTQLAAPQLVSPFITGSAFHPWLAVVNQCLVAADSRETLERMIDFYLLGGSLAMDTTFLRATQDLLRESGMDCWLRLDAEQARALGIGERPVAGLFRTWPVAGGLQRGEGKWHAVTALSTGPALAWTREPTAGPSQGLWTIRAALGAASEGLLWQQGNQWLALDPAGELLWERPGQGTLLGPPQRFFLADGRSCLLLTTTEGWITLDFSSGEAIDFLPTISSRPATLPTWIDFDRNGRWKLLLPTQTGGILAFDQEGKPWPTWAPTTDTVPPRFPLLHYQLPQRDFVVGFDSTRRWRVWSRTGEERFSLAGPAGALIGPAGGQCLDDSGAPDRCRLVVAEQSGRAQIVSFGGESFPLPLGFSPAEEFLFVDLWGDERKDYLIRRGAELQLFGYDEEGFRERWTQLFPRPVRDLRELPGRGLAAWSPDSRQVYVLNGQGQVLPGFPVAGERFLCPLSLPDGGRGLATLVGEAVYVYRLP